MTHIFFNNADKSTKAKRIFACFNPSLVECDIDLGDFDLSNFKQIADIDRFDENGLNTPLVAKTNILKMPELSLLMWIEEE